jgi:NADPH-dependent ferric siderophore reductase
MPRDAVGHAIVELIDAADAQDVDAPAGMTLHWVPRGTGGTALARLREIEWLPGTPYVFAVGEAKIATGARRYAVGERGVPKGNVTFCGYWKAGKA